MSAQEAMTEPDLTAPPEGIFGRGLLHGLRRHGHHPMMRA
jgi:hypothetical protein